jgi:hypothetical protein
MVTTQLFGQPLMGLMLDWYIWYQIPFQIQTGKPTEYQMKENQSLEILLYLILMEKILHRMLKYQVMLQDLHT